MDEILIEEKKYISSKQAAKMTGYAKDYIGQLCREGRVPARLIGRSWYVLESAIQDHRFGDVVEVEPEEIKEVDEKPSEPASIVSPTWESPRYEAVSEDLLPSLNRLKDINTETIMDEQGEKTEATKHIHDSWREWFDRFDHKEDNIEPEKIEEQHEEREIRESVEEDTEDTNVNVPIHTIHRTVHQLPPEDLLPNKTQDRLSESKITTRRKNSGVGIKTVQVAGILLATALATSAIISSGYFDVYILSNKQVSALAGVAVYNK